MTYTFKLARRLAVLRSVALVSGLLLGAACAEDTATAPGDGPSITPTPVPLDNSSQVDTISSVANAMTATLRKIYLAPANVSIKTYRTQQYRWYARTMSWDSVPVQVTLTATGGTITPSGLFTAGKDAGTYRVIATLGHFVDTSIVVLAAAPPPSWAPVPTGTAGTVPTLPPTRTVPSLSGRAGSMVFGAHDMLRTTPETAGGGSLRLSLDAYNASSIVSRIERARANKYKLVLALTGGSHYDYMTNGVFDRAKWEAKWRPTIRPPFGTRSPKAWRTGPSLGAR